MENLYGVQVNNKFDLFIDEDEDPLELIAQQEEAKKQAELKKKKEAEKGKKSKSGKKAVLKTENKIIEVIEPKKEGNYCLYYLNWMLQKQLNKLSHRSRQHVCKVAIFQCQCALRLDLHSLQPPKNLNFKPCLIRVDAY